MRSERVIIGTRGSTLALRQAKIVVSLLQEQEPNVEYRVEVVSTRGDRIQDRPISMLGDKGVFVRPLEQALLSGRVDIAVHSLKDVPSDVETTGLVLAAFPQRADPRDVLVSRFNTSFLDLPGGARLGTGSIRRRAQLQELRPDVQILSIRGNVDTRLRKLEQGEYDAVVLAAAGLSRLGLLARVSEYFSVDAVVPDAGQGILALQTRDTGGVRDLAASIDNLDVRAAAIAERAVLRALNADCHSPVGAYAATDGAALRLQGFAADDSGQSLHRVSEVGSVEAAEEIGVRAGLGLLRLLSGAGPYTEK